MAEHPNAALVRRALDAMDGSDMSVLDEIVADDIAWHYIGGDEPLRGKATMSQSMAPGNRDYTISVEVHDVTASDEHVVALVKAHAVRGDQTLDYDTAEIFHVRDGQVTERWAFSDDTARIVEFFA